MKSTAAMELAHAMQERARLMQRLAQQDALIAELIARLATAK
jgi:hypothetical protein